MPRSKLERRSTTKPPLARSEILALCLCAQRDLSKESVRCLPKLTKAPFDWHWLVHVAKRHRLLPLLHRNLAAYCPHAVPPGVMEKILEECQDIAIRNLVFSGDLIHVLKAFQEAGIEAVPYKGPVLTELAYGNLALRDFDDLDILVREADLQQAKKILLTNGFQPAGNEDLGQLFVENSCHFVFTNSRHGYLAELHWAVVPSYFPLAFNQARFWRRLRRVRFGGLEVLAHAPEQLVLLLCIHGGKHHWSRLAWVADLAGIIRNHPELDWSELIAEAHRLRCRRLLLLGLWLAVELLDAPVPECVSLALIDDQEVGKLGEEVCGGIFEQEDHSWAGVKNVSFLCRVRECMRDRVVYVLRRALTPTEKEWTLQKIPGPFQALYSPFRGFRLLAEHGARILRCAAFAEKL